MKYALMFSGLLFFNTFCLAQNTDCQLIEALVLANSSKKQTLRMTMQTSAKTYKSELIVETDINGNTRIITAIDGMGNKKMETEALRIDGKMYSKSSTNNVWRKTDVNTMAQYQKMNVDYSKMKFTNCKFVGEELIKGVKFVIFEFDATFGPASGALMKMRHWVNKADSFILKSRIIMNGLPADMKIDNIVEYGVDVKNIVVPTDFIADNKPATAYERKAPEYKYTYLGLSVFMKDSLEYPTLARESKIEGEVIVSFDVEPDGGVCNLKIIKGLGYGCDEAALKLIEKTDKKWLPATQLGKPIRINHKATVPFVLAK
jgi:TonB family protein